MTGSGYEMSGYDGLRGLGAIAATAMPQWSLQTRRSAESLWQSQNTSGA